jgi:hypothetical protein
MFALLLLYFVLPVRSECELMRTVALVPVYRWFCGFGLFTQLPDHSTLHHFRKQVGTARFQAILTLVILRCIEQGLVGNDLLCFDMKGVSASARVWSPYERAVLLTWALIRYLEQVEEGDLSGEPLSEAVRQVAAQVAIEVLENKKLQQNKQAPSRVLQSLERWTSQRQEANGQALWEIPLEQAVRIQLEEEAEMSIPQTQTERRRWLKQLAQRLKDSLPHACGDRDARVGWVNDVALKCGYWLGFLIDGLHNVITAVSVVPLNVHQNTQMTSAVDVHRDRVDAYPKAVAADSVQDHYSVHQWLDERQIEGHIASRERRTHGGGFSVGHFAFDEQGELRCPAGKRLTAGKTGKDGRTPFRAQSSDCAACPLKAECLPKRQRPNGPRFVRLRCDSHRRWLQNRAHTQTEAYKVIQKKRFASEGLFGLAARLHRADKMPYRSQPMNHIAGLLIGTAMNLALLVRQAATA